MLPVKVRWIPGSAKASGIGAKISVVPETVMHSESVPTNAAAFFESDGSNFTLFLFEEVKVILWAVVRK